MESFEQALSKINGIVLADGKVDIGEVAWLLRFVRPFVLQGNPHAIALQKALKRVDEDGIVTAEESAKLAQMLEAMICPKLKLADYVREIDDFPKPGVKFRDVTGILDNGESFNLALNEITEALEGIDFDVVTAPESRGFIFGAAVAARFGKAFVPVRKPGKLPRATISESYDLEYGKAELHMHVDAVIRGERAVIVDDLLATGGTAKACARLVERLGGTVACMVFPIELEGFGARANALKDYNVVSLIKYQGR